MTMLPSVAPPLQTANKWARPLTMADPFDWLAQGWSDFRTQMPMSLAYGLLILAISLGLVSGLIALKRDYILFPVFAGFMVIGPILAVGLYEKSRRIEQGLPVSWRNLFFVRPRSGGQILFTGVLLCLLMIVWIRAAVLIYALFFGMVAFPGLDRIAPMLFTTVTGWAMLIVGTLVGGLFAAFSFAISAFSIPMLLDQRTDALTAMGSSMALVWNNLRVLMVWAAIVLGLFLASLATGMIGLIVTYPLLGHATWHAYRAVQPDTE
ncbi:DUF2189 domain-containing protein [Bradyrhizobium sp. CER78]|uniref:DUF2189 domain-containing protein n=1 Tax=Bradyrhizobium sp. CER78 TaxID=3039162 RepID=UPI002449DD9C|nr:DUF2189 domain-containing protein [Bradyrhizobium sp. CER78]MDH2385486.1 DUF2189 domain-containing protein [Bradyrhizobium sp. CER78]